MNAHTLDMATSIPGTIYSYILEESILDEVIRYRIYVDDEYQGIVRHLLMRYKIVYEADYQSWTLKYSSPNRPHRVYQYPNSMKYVDLLQFFLPRPNVPIRSNIFTCVFTYDEYPEWVPYLDWGRIEDSELIKTIQLELPLLFHYPNTLVDKIHIARSYADGLMELQVYSHPRRYLNVIDFLCNRIANEERGLNTEDVKVMADLLDE